MTEFSRRSGERLKRVVKKVERQQDPPPPGRQPGNVPILLVRAQEPIASGASGDVKRLVRNSHDDNKGSEATVGEPFRVYNRFGDIEEDDDVYVRWIDGGYEVINSRRGPADASRCGVCSQVGGLVVPITGDVDATEVYTFSPACDGSLFITFTHDTSLTWLGTATSLLLDCGGETPRTLAPTMVVRNLLPGTATDGVEILLPDGTGNVAVYHNIAAWQPCVPARFRLDDYDDTCPCVPWDPFTCLTPVDGS